MRRSSLVAGLKNFARAYHTVAWVRPLLLSCALRCLHGIVLVEADSGQIKGGVYNVKRYH